MPRLSSSGPAPHGRSAAIQGNDAWVARFHAGDQDTLAQCYRDYFGLVKQSVGRVLRGADRENVIHDVFCDLCARAKTRRSFRSGSFAAWLSRVSRNRALDYLTRQQRESPVPADKLSDLAGPERPPHEDRARLSELVRQMNAALPEKLQQVFEVRFMQQLSQREAARELGVSRTTLAYREHRVRKFLKRYAKEGMVS